jgi:hypothetical protein
MAIKKQDSAKLKKLILAAIDKYDADDLLEFMFENCLSTNEEDYVLDKMRYLISLDGDLVIKTNGLSLMKRDKIIDFLDTEIFPHYNDQVKNIFQL